MFIEIVIDNRPTLFNLLKAQTVQPLANGIEIILPSGKSIKSSDYSYELIKEMIEFRPPLTDAEIMRRMAMNNPFKK